MRIRLTGWRAWCVIAAAGAAVACVAWATRPGPGPVPEIPRPGPSAFTEPEVKEDVLAAERRVEEEPRSAAARAAAAAGDDRTAAEFLADLTEHPSAARQALLLRSEICRRQGRTSYADYLAGRAAELPDGIWPDPIADPVRSRDLSHGGRL